MKLRSIDLAFFRQHRESRIEFPEGLTAIIGPNGAGKSTIVEAIAFALFGTQAIRGKIEFLRTRTEEGKGKKSEPLVKLVLEHDGVVFRIERSTSDASLFVAGEGQPMALGNREVTSRISSIIGMSYEEFIATYCTEQKGLEFLSGKKGATEREKFIVRMMGFDRLEDVQEKLRSDRKDRRNELAGFEASLGNRDVLEQQLAREKDELAVARQQHEEAKRVLTRAETDHDALKKRMEVHEELRTRHGKLRDEEKTILVRAEEKKKRAESIADEIVRLGFAKEVTLEELHEQSEALAVQARNLEDRLRTASEAIESARRLAETKESEWREALTAARLQREGIVVRVRELEKRRTSREGLKSHGDCPTCGQKLGPKFTDILTHLRLEEEDLRASLEAIDDAVAKLDAPPESLVSAKEAARAREAEAEHLRVSLRESESRRAPLLRAERTFEERKTLVEEERSLEKDLERVRAAMKELRFQEDVYLREKGAYDATQRLLEVARLQRVKLDGELQTKEALIGRTQQEIQRLAEKLVLVDNARKELRLLDESDRLLSEFRKHLNSAIRPRLAELASEYLADLTDGRYTAVELAADFTPTVIDDGEPKPVISGGEQDILNLCMRLSLSHMIADRAGQVFSLLVLDEVFGSLDEGRRSNVLQLLEKLSKRFDQILIITHLDDVKDGVRNTVHVEYDETTGTALASAVEEYQGFAYNV